MQDSLEHGQMAMVLIHFMAVNWTMYLLWPLMILVQNTQYVTEHTVRPKS